MGRWAHVGGTEGGRSERSRFGGKWGWAWVAGVLGGVLVGNLGAGEPSPAAPLPAGYRLLYAQDFVDAAAIRDFEFSDPAAWRVSMEAGRGAMELHTQSQYTPRVRSPVNVALVRGHEFGDFVLEVELRQTGREYGHRDMCVFFGFKDPANFYYVHLATQADDHAHNVFLVNDEPRVKIGEPAGTGVDWGVNVWRKVRVERRVAEGTIRVFFDDMAKPVMTATDKHFDSGRLGFGSFDDTGKVARIRVWGPDSVPKKSGMFR